MYIYGQLFFWKDEAWNLGMCHGQVTCVISIYFPYAQGLSFPAKIGADTFL